MPAGIYIAPTHMTPDMYDEVMRRLDTAGAAAPKGRTYHASFLAGDNLDVFDVWDSQQDFDALGQILMPILAAVGIDIGEPRASPIHDIVTG